MKTLLLQRICSSFFSGRTTAERLLRQEPLELEDEEESGQVAEAMRDLTPEEADHLQAIVRELSRPEARDPKLNAVLYFLTEHRPEGRTWLEHGCIVFSQYYDTAFALARQLAALLAGEPVAVYAGVGKSGLLRGEHFAAVEREEIKAAVKERRVRLVLATDAACEGLNLQTRRIKRIGQARRNVDMLNLVYADTQDEQVYRVLSHRMKDRFDIFGGLPDTIEDDWIEGVERMEAMMDRYLHLRRQARDVFELRYQSTLDPDQHRWERCARVLSRRDVVERLSRPW